MDLLSMYAERQPEKTALIDDRPGQTVRTWTFAQLDRQANQLGHLLRSVGVDTATKVCWCGQNSGPLVVATHAIRKVGAVGVPLNYRLTPDEAAYVIDNSDASVVYVDREYADLIAEVRDRTPKVREVLV
ncbi:MAG TPA: AMP-binding protein, partial [Acidimicrobiales bacterium]|nr:AMP-binding protein [Acidimicrobiales bacterium]